MLRILLVGALLLSVSLVTIVTYGACGKTKKKNQDCHIQPTCAGPADVNCTSRRDTVSFFPGLFSSETCAPKCNTEAATDGNVADCRRDVNCVNVGANCQRGAGTPQLQTLATLETYNCT